jgi:hypothetical protein
VKGWGIWFGIERFLYKKKSFILKVDSLFFLLYIVRLRGYSMRRWGFDVGFRNTCT